MKKWILRILALPWLVFGNWQWFAWQVGQARLKWDLCPFCNSDAPLIYHCPVCRVGYGELWPPSSKQKEAWSENFWKWLYRPDKGGMMGQNCCQNNIIYEVEVGCERSEEQLFEDTPEAYRVEKANTASGIIVFGRYPGGRWIPNPSCRELIAHLLRSGGHLGQCGGNGENG